MGKCRRAIRFQRMTTYSFMVHTCLGIALMSVWAMACCTAALLTQPCFCLQEVPGILSGSQAAGQHR